MQHLVGLHKGLFEAHVARQNLEQTLVGHHDVRVGALGQPLQPLTRQGHLARALKAKGRGDDGHREGAKLHGCSRHHRGRAGAGATAHASGDEHHLSALERLFDLLVRLLGSLLAQRGVAARATAMGHTGPQP